MKISLKIKAILLFLCLYGTAVNAQQDSQYTQYMYNTITVNPAYAGSRDVLSIFGMYRTQWIGLEGAPKTANFSVNMPMNERLGLGISVVDDRIGPSTESNLAADISYNIPLKNDYRLFFGIKASANFLNIDYTKLSIYNPNDINYQSKVDKQFSPNVGAGLYLHSKKGYVGLSTPFILETKHYDINNSTVEARENMHYYLIAGHVFDLSNSVKFKPAVLSKVVKGAPIQLDLSANFLFSDKFIFGAAYRWDAAVSGMVGFQITPGLLAGYSYDADTTNLGSYNSGSHEVFLRFELFKETPEKVISPRFF
jgi:type IX secretion system PorP/SprF family membrane protein